MEGSMNVHVDDIISNHDNDEILEYLKMCWKTIKFESSPSNHNSNDNKERVDYPIIDH